MAWFVISDAGRSDAEQNKGREKIGFREVLRVLKMPVVWLISVVIITAYSAYWGSYYFTPYATDVFKMSVVFGGIIGTAKMWVKPLIALPAGLLADKIGVSKTVAWSFAILILSFGVFIFSPGNPNLV